MTDAWDILTGAAPAPEPTQALIDLMQTPSVFEDLKRGIGSMMAGGVTPAGREEDDYYQTPVEATQAGMILLTPFMNPNWTVHEMCCGEGRMSKVIEEFGHKVISTDLIDRGYGTQMNIFDIIAPMADMGMTNPPFNLAEEILRHTLEHLKPRVFAMLLKSTWFHADERRSLFYETTPRLIGALPWRLDFKDLGRPTMECSWFVWERGYTGATQYDICEKLNPKRRAKKISKPA